MGIARGGAILILMLLAIPALAQEDYARQRQEAGVEEYRAGNFRRAEEEFRQAAFASLNDASRYLESLARLVVALDAEGKRDEVEKTLTRFLSIEEMEGGYSASALEPDFRKAFHDVLLRSTPRERIERLPRLAEELGLVPAPATTTAPSSTHAPAAPSAATTGIPTVAATPEPTRTFTLPPAATDTPSPTATVPPSPTRTATAVPTSTPSPTLTATSTLTRTSSETPTSTRTPTPTASSTPTASRTATATARPSATRTATPVPTSTPSPTRTLTSTRTRTPSETPTSTRTSAPTATRTATAIPTARPSPTRTAPAIFVPPRQVDTPPRPIRRVMPIYPPEALRKRVRGLVVLRVLVSEKGEPVEIRVEKGRTGLTDAAREAVRQWRFEPATKAGRPVRTFTTVEIPFEAILFARTPFPEAPAPAPSPTRVKSNR